MAGMVRMAGMVERQKEWQNGRMAEMATYLLFMVYTNDDDDDNDDTLIFYITDVKSTFTLRCNTKKVRFVRCTKHYVCPRGRYNESNAGTNCGITKVNFDQSEVK